MSLADRLKIGMRRLASGVCVISSCTETAKFAMTASSVTSLSDNPASLLMCINQGAAMQSILVPGHPFAVNILAYEQQDISTTCAQKNTAEERFAVGQWLRHDGNQLPYLPSAQAVFFCEVDNAPYFYGTHQIVIGKLTEVLVSQENVRPLIYVDGGYQQLSSV
ncbi:MAG: flavin reductase family protein [Cellvibrionaceae bacterium]|nr:flavin reductase family protein [Cellvibrionaceae bacterium]